MLEECLVCRKHRGEISVLVAGIQGRRASIGGQRWMNGQSRRKEMKAKWRRSPTACGRFYASSMVRFE